MSLIEADTGSLATKGYHYTSMALIPLFPAALLMSPSKWVFPVDVALGIVVPLHGGFRGWWVERGVGGKGAHLRVYILDVGNFAP